MMMRLLKQLKQLTGFNKIRSGIGRKKVNRAIENVIDSVDVRLRLVPSYRQKLYEAVSVALVHIDRVVDRVPGPIDVSRKNFTRVPAVRAFFATPDVLQEVLSSSSELKDFFADEHNSEFDTCYALLCSNKQEKTVVGSCLVNDRVRHDQLQSTINFFDYKVLSPAASDRDVRKGIKQCIFDGLVTHALLHIASIKTRRRDLQDQQRILHSQLRVRQSQGNGLSGMLAEGHEQKARIADIEQQYLEAGRELDQMTGEHDVLAFYLDEVISILAKPEDFINLKESCFRLNDMGIMVDDELRASNVVCFSEIEIADVMKRVVTVVSCQRAEMDRKN